MNKNYLGKYFMDKNRKLAYECLAQLRRPLYIVLLSYSMENKTYKIIVYNEEEIEKHLEENEYIGSMYFNKEDSNYISALNEIKGGV